MEENKIYSARRVVDNPDFYGGGYELVTGRRTDNKQYSRSAWAYACMDIRGTELSNLPWRLVSKRGKVIEKHPIIDMLQTFGPESNWIEAIAASEVDLLMFGAAYWLKDVDILQRLNPQTIEVVSNNSGISYFKQTLDQADGTTVRRNFSRDDVIYFREYNPDDQLNVGIPAMKIIQNAIDTEFAAIQHIEAHFKNGAIPGIVFETKKYIPQEEINRFIHWWNARFRGVKNRAKVAVVGDDMKANVIAANMQENAIVAIRDQARDDICVGMRVPKLLVGSLVDATYENLAESRKFLIEDVILPRAKYFAGIINQDFISQIDPNIVFEFAEDELQILQEDSSLKEARLGSMFDRGIINDEYYRLEMGIEESAAPIEEPEEDEQALRSWEKKSMKALKRGDKADVEFESDTISEDKQRLLHLRLAQADTADAVRASFR